MGECLLRDSLKNDFVVIEVDPLYGFQWGMVQEILEMLLIERYGLCDR